MLKQNDRETSFLKERIRQAKLAFKVFLGATVLSGIVSFAGVYLLLSGHISQGATISTEGLRSCVVLAKLAKDAQDSRNRAIKEAKDEDEVQ